MFRKGSRDTRKWTTLSIIVIRLTFTQRKIKPWNKEGTHPISILYEGAQTDCAFTPEQEQREQTAFHELALTGQTYKCYVRVLQPYKLPWFSLSLLNHTPAWVMKLERSQWMIVYRASPPRLCGILLLDWKNLLPGDDINIWRASSLLQIWKWWENCSHVSLD